MSSRVRPSRPSRRPTPGRTIAGLSAGFLAGTVLLAACTSSTEPAPNPDASTSTAPATTEVTTPVATSADAPVDEPVDIAVDVGVDLEADVIVLGVRGDVDPAELAGVQAYWAANTVGDRFGVIVSETDEQVLAVALDASPLPVEMLDLAAMAPTQSIDSVAAGRLLDATRPTLGQMIGAIDRAMDLDEVTGAPGDFRVEAGETCPFDPMTFQLDAGSDAGIVFVCGTPAFAASVLADVPPEVGTVVVANEAWSNDLVAVVADGVQVVVLGSVPPPSESAPASDVMALLGGDHVADAAWVRGYTAAQSMHVVLNEAFDAGDLTRAGVMDAIGRAGDEAIGFGVGAGDVTVGVPDATSPTGVRVIGVVQP